ncbi:Scr1 family TA system antitoxin-like transcriptional regulator [Streptomyces sp. Isolate_219]|uniref:Scr1 family TA system antitoxin-like transcriptional regulator n=1 Tax=Streptomyces sp. Isolate_219 TaxID=2950110 RepID=UPI0021C978D5|nr:Scr1 family TA system antitoxin-like transcriptional regulator [Streptomyces sp. Isolate_219]
MRRCAGPSRGSPPAPARAGLRAGHGRGAVGRPGGCPPADPGAPLRRRSPPAMDGTHTIFRFDTGSPVVVVEPMTTSLYLEEDADVGQYHVNFNHLRSQALDTKGSRAFIRDVIKEIR